MSIYDRFQEREAENNKQQQLVDTIKELYEKKNYDYKNGNCEFTIKNTIYTINEEYLKATYKTTK